MTIENLRWFTGKSVCLALTFMLCGLLANDLYGQRTRGQGGIKGGNVKSITYAKPGSTKPAGSMTLSNGKWVEKNRDGTFQFTEQSRDEWSVYLVKANGAKLQIDLYRNKIIWGGRDFYDVLTASATGGGGGGGNTNDVTYNVIVSTGNVSGAGTDSNILLVIHGSNGSTHAMALNSKIRGNAFESGSKDRVSLSAKDVGQMNSITLFSDNAYAGSDWFPDNVQITKGQEKKRFRFQRWFKKGADRHRVNAEGQNNPHPQPQPQPRR